MTIKTILKKLTASDKKDAKNFSSSIREFEEIEKGIFVAFVDDEVVSWDVRIYMTKSGTRIKDTSCDCGSKKSFCAHKIAVLVYMEEGHTGHKTIARKIVTKKSTKADKLMSAVADDDKILDWLRDKLNKDKVFRLAFENDLLQAKTVMDADFLQLQYKTAYKTIIGRKRNASAAELPKFLELMQPYFEDAIATIFNYPSEAETKKLYLRFLDLSASLNYLPKRPTTRTNTFIKKCIKKPLTAIPANSEHLSQLAKTLVGADHNEINVTDLFHPVLERYGELLDKEKVEKLMATRLKPIMKYMTTEKTLIKYVELSQTLGIFEKLESSFALLSYQNKYNDSLLSALMTAGLYERVKKECNFAIKENTPKYQAMYFDYLMQVAEIENDDSQVFNIIMLKLTSTPLYEDYKKLYDLKLSEKQEAVLIKYSQRIVLSSSYGAYREYIRMKFLYWEKNESLEPILKKLKDKPTLAYSYHLWDKLWILDKELFMQKGAEIFKYSFSFQAETARLRELVADFIKTKLGSLSETDILALSKKTRDSLTYIDINI